MKKILALALLILSFGCKNTSEELTTLKGSYMFFEDAAVLQASNEIYGVYLNDKAIALDEASKKFKPTPTDVIIAEVKGRVSTEKHEKILVNKFLSGCNGCLHTKIMPYVLTIRCNKW